MRGIRERLSADDGMSLVEVVVAAAILFFIMTAILGLVGRTTLIGVQARQMNTVNNAVNSYIEWVRALPFGNVEVEPTGSLETTTITTPDFSVEIVPTVQPVMNGTETDANLKYVWLAVRATKADGTFRVTNTQVVIHNHDQYLNEGSQGPATDPTISFIGDTPPDGTIIWYNTSTGASEWKDATGTLRTLQIQARAEASSGRSVDEVYMEGEQTWDLQEYLTNKYARWYAPTWSDSPVFRWNLNQKTTLGEPLVEDGLRSVYAYVKDSVGVIRYEVRQFLVDTYPPAPTGPVSHQFASTMCGVLTWPVSMDGTNPAFGYRLDMRKQPLTAAAAYSSWLAAGYYSLATNEHVLAKEPMSRYYARVLPFSPRGNNASAYSDRLHFVTRPKLTGTYVVTKRTSNPKGWTVASSLAATPPSFESTGTTYSWYDGATLLATTTTKTFAVPAVSVDGDTNTTPFPSRSYSVVVRTQPLGLPSGTANPAVEVKSNVVTTAATASGTFTFAEGTW